MVGGGEAEIAMRGAGDRALKALVSTDDHIWRRRWRCGEGTQSQLVDEIEGDYREELGS